MAVHAGLQAFFFITGHGMCCHRNDRHISDFGFQISDFPRGGVSIHHRHLDIHKNHIIWAFLDHIDCLLSVIGQADHQIGTFENFFGYLLVNFVIFHQQDVSSPDKLQRISFFLLLCNP